MEFSGFDRDVLAFYAELRADNTKDWWTANKARYERHVHEPMLRLAADLEDEFGEMKIFRPYRDVRFSADKSPYKLHIGMVTAARPAHYLHLSEEGLLTGGGVYEVPPAALARFRERVDDEASARVPRVRLAALDAREFELIDATALCAPPRVDTRPTTRASSCCGSSASPSAMTIRPPTGCGRPRRVRSSASGGALSRSGAAGSRRTSAMPPIAALSAPTRTADAATGRPRHPLLCS